MIVIIFVGVVGVVGIVFVRVVSISVVVLRFVLLGLVFLRSASVGLVFPACVVVIRSSLFLSLSNRGGSGNGTQDGADNFTCQPAGFGLELGHCLLLILFESGARFLDLSLGAGTSFIHGATAYLRGLLAARFEIFEDLLASLAQPLLVVGGASLSGGNIGARFFHGPLSTLLPLSQHSSQRTMHHKNINNVQEP
jgi:hypothetical protein